MTYMDLKAFLRTPEKSLLRKVQHQKKPDEAIIVWTIGLGNGKILKIDTRTHYCQQLNPTLRFLPDNNGLKLIAYFKDVPHRSCKISHPRHDLPCRSVGKPHSFVFYSGLP